MQYTEDHRAAAWMASQVTQLLRRFRNGERSALDELMPIVYDELRRIANSYLRRQRPEHTLQPTALVHEAYVKLFEETSPAFADRAHFLALMSQVMRQILVDHARALASAKRGGQWRRVTWDTNFDVGADPGGRSPNVIELDGALEALAREDPPLARVIEMHYFGGMTAEETAVVVGRSAHVIRHDLRLARAWLRRELSRNVPGNRPRRV